MIQNNKIEISLKLIIQILLKLIQMNWIFNLIYNAVKILNYKLDWKNWLPNVIKDIFKSH